jgi:hypothetical protein
MYRPGILSSRRWIRSVCTFSAAAGDHLCAKGIVSQRRHVIHPDFVLIDLSGKVNGRVERVTAKAAFNVVAFFRQFNHAFTDNGDFFMRHGFRPVVYICFSLAFVSVIVNFLKQRFNLIWDEVKR